MYMVTLFASGLAIYTGIIVVVLFLGQGIYTCIKFHDMQDAVFIHLRMKTGRYSEEEGVRRLLALKFYRNKEYVIVSKALQLVPKDIDAEGYNTSQWIKDAVLAAIKLYKKEKKTRRHIM